MSTRPTFEDRLLDELKAEIELRETGVRRTGSTAVEPRPGGTRGAVRRLFTPPRIAVVAAACALAWFGGALVPGSSAYSTAYAVERHGDGTVTLSVKDQTIDVAAQRELATRVRPWGIEVTIDVLAPGYVCERSRFTPFPVWAVDRHGNRVPVIPIKASWDFTLHRGNVLTFENMEGMSRPRAVELYSTKSQAEPCVPLKVTLPDD
ncbi:hypothetical protein G9272_03290 [Streptomyces asoensis]|uniref:Uncharacterized protein n=1 Tax=Streptomyces asoensis TaxID=249586 RepID=A0A6M4WHQ4_9ACTN|nr:hypothetical protein [Streptomyces asoensis]QJS99450.1 hypothetical protein G9272_03290 [Streptomyces asoensis]